MNELTAPTAILASINRLPRNVHFKDPEDLGYPCALRFLVRNFADLDQTKELLGLSR